MLESCGTPRSLTNGQTSYTSTTVESIVTYTCDPGYMMTAGNSSRRCQSVGLWSGNLPTCTRKSTSAVLSNDLLYIRSKKWCGKGLCYMAKKVVNSRTFRPRRSSSATKLNSQSFRPVAPVVPSVLQLMKTFVIETFLLLTSSLATWIGQIGRSKNV